MEIKSSLWRGSGYKLKLDRLDRETLLALRDERVYDECSEDEMPRLDNLFYEIGRIAQNRNLRVIRLQESDLLDLSDGLEEFSQRTPAAVREIPKFTYTAPYTNADMSHRALLGYHAAEMSDQIETLLDNQPQPLTGAEPSFDDMEAGLSRLLAENSPDPE